MRGRRRLQHIALRIRRAGGRPSAVALVGGEQGEGFAGERGGEAFAPQTGAQAALTQAQADQLSLTGQGRGIAEAIIGTTKRFLMMVDFLGIYFFIEVNLVVFKTLVKVS